MEKSIRRAIDSKISVVYQSILVYDMYTSTCVLEKLWLMLWATARQLFLSLSLSLSLSFSFLYPFSRSLSVHLPPKLLFLRLRGIFSTTPNLDVQFRYVWTNETTEMKHTQKTHHIDKYQHCTEVMASHKMLEIAMKY